MICLHISFLAFNPSGQLHEGSFEMCTSYVHEWSSTWAEEMMYIQCDGLMFFVVTTEILDLCCFAFARLL